MAKYKKIATNFFQKDSFFNGLEENATNKIYANIKWLETDIIYANWNSDEMSDIISWWEKSIIWQIYNKWKSIDINAIKIAWKIWSEWVNNKELKTLKNFIDKFVNFLNWHNITVWTNVKERIWLNTDKKIKDLSKN